MIETETATKPAERPAGQVPAAPAEEISVLAVEDVEALECTSRWEDLAAAAIEPNVFQEPWMLLPALR